MKNIEFGGMAYADFRKEIFELLADMEHRAYRISFIVSGLKEYSHTEYVKEKRWIDLKSLIEKTCAFCQEKKAQGDEAKRNSVLI